MVIYWYVTILLIFQDHFTKCKQSRDGQGSVQDARQKNIKDFLQGVKRKGESANVTTVGKGRFGRRQRKKVPKLTRTSMLLISNSKYV